MPTSNLAIAPIFLNYLHRARGEIAASGRLRGRRFTVLDVGPGRGKYGYLIREYVDPDAIVDAVEAWEPYVDDFGLRNIYRDVIVADVLDLDDEDLAGYDAVFMGDVLEHIEKRSALELLDRIPGAVVIATPRDYFPNPPDLPPTEAHISHWTRGDFEALPRFVEIHIPAIATLGALIARLRPQ